MEIRPVATAEMRAKCANAVPEIQLTDRYAARTADKAVHNFIAESGDQVAGFLIGYDEADGYFYNYLFGVAPGFRRRGVGQRLFDHVEAWARGEGYRGMRVQSRNKFPDMLRLLIKNQYKIVAYIDRGDPDRSPIRFEKAWAR